jgi:hypothetical protein
MARYENFRPTHTLNLHLFVLMCVRSHRQPTDMNAVQNCHSTEVWLVVTAAQTQLQAPIITPDIDLPSVHDHH